MLEPENFWSILLYYKYYVLITNVFTHFFSGFSNLVVLRLTDLADPVDIRFRDAEVKVMFKIIIISNIFEHLITTNHQMNNWGRDPG